jgi:hypothetical protein
MSLGVKDVLLCAAVAVGVSVLTFSIADKLEQWWKKCKSGKSNKSSKPTRYSTVEDIAIDSPDSQFDSQL